MSRRIPRYKREAAKTSPKVKMSTGSVPADIAQQAPHNSFAAVPLIYRDKPFKCIDCGSHEVWTAQQQKWWHETAKGSIYSTANRCRACRQTLRAAHGGIPRRSHGDRRQRQQE